MIPEPTLFSYPLSTLFLYFMFYSVAGWMMETVYCSILERRFVPRGFLYGPLCPIYGVGVLLMVLFFQPLAGNIVVFYLVSTVTMSAWEYFVGWFLETTTHIKYWDYSMYRFNLKGRICLWVCLVWGVLSYICVCFLHPPVAGLIDRIPPLAQRIWAVALAVAVGVDAAITIRELALMTKALNKLQEMAGELQMQMSLGKAELSDTLEDVKESVGGKLRAAYRQQVAAAERRTRRFRRIYADFRASRVSDAARRDVREHARKLLEARKEKSHKRKES